MVTIDPKQTVLNVAKSNPAANVCKTSDGGFDTIFKNMVDAKTTEIAKAEPAHVLSDVRPARFAAESIPSSNMIIDQVQQLIDTMEVYQQKLIEKGTTLKEIQALVQQMASQSESLGAVSNAAGEMENLKPIVDQSLMLSSMEMARFNSGQYNDT